MGHNLEGNADAVTMTRSNLHHSTQIVRRLLLALGILAACSVPSQFSSFGPECA